MKYTFVLFFSFILATSSICQSREITDGAVITASEGRTQITVNDKGALNVNVSAKDLNTFKAKGWVSYRDLGAKGDGKTDDINAIVATHAVANQYGLEVKVDEVSTYYISGKDRTAVIRTNTDFGKAAFIVDDTEVEDSGAAVFLVGSTMKSYKLKSITPLKRNQQKIDVELPGSCLISVTNSKVKHYIRYGLNQNNGSAQTDIFLVDKEGNVDMDAPIIWDFDHISEIIALPIDLQPLTIRGGIFTTIANKGHASNSYYNRNIAIRRSNVIVDELEHRIIGEGKRGAPYGGFLNIGDCAYVTVKNTTLTGHKTYSKIGNAGKPVAMGTYDLSVNRALNITFENCRQTNDINDTKYWGILGSNYCKNLIYDRCTLSRFDAHKGVANATIRNSVLGHMGINAIGSGTLLVENSTIQGKSLVNFRSDYGSTWQGNVIIRDCVFIPAGGKAISADLFNISNSGQHDFGYTCYMPEHFTIENLQIIDTNTPKNYAGAAIFSDFSPVKDVQPSDAPFPYVVTKSITLKNVTTSSGKALRISDNSGLYKDVKVTYDTVEVKH